MAYTVCPFLTAHVQKLIAQNIFIENCVKMKILEIEKIDRNFQLKINEIFDVFVLDFSL